MKARLIFAGVLILVLVGFLSTGVARVSVDIRINPPPLVISEPPEMVVIPGTYVYFSPGVGADIFFYQGYWYRPYQGYWYRAGSYNGPWVYIVSARVPNVLFHLPQDFRTMSEYRRIPYRELRGNWRKWEREKYWDRIGWGRHEREREHGVAPRYGEQHRRDFDRHRGERHDYYDRHREGR